MITPGVSPSSICLKVFDVDIAVSCSNQDIYDWLLRGYGALVSPGHSASLNYIAGKQADGGYYLMTPDGATLIAGNDSQFLYNFEKDLTLALQSVRQDLYFIHGAALALADLGFLFVASSGSGKSTTTWAALHHGFDYLSDELAPIDLAEKRIMPYPHALCLKAVPPAPYTLPAATLFTARTIHVPTECLPSVVRYDPIPLNAIFFVKYQPENSEPSISSLSPAEAAARLYTNGLNQLAHKDSGLSGAIAICQDIPAFELFTTSRLESAIQLLRSTLSSI
jgi:hypothetical protein